MARRDEVRALLRLGAEADAAATGGAPARSEALQAGACGLAGRYFVAGWRGVRLLLRAVGLAPALAAPAAVGPVNAAPLTVRPFCENFAALRRPRP